MFQHLTEQKMGYFEHLIFAWRMALALIIHGAIPCVLTTYVSDRICPRDHG